MLFLRSVFLYRQKRALIGNNNNKKLDMLRSDLLLM